MKYVGLQQQISSNNRKSILLLMAFPLLVLVMVFIFFLAINYTEEGLPPIDLVIEQFLNAIPVVLLAVGIWFVVAYFANSAMINSAAKSHTLSRKDNMM